LITSVTKPVALLRISNQESKCILARERLSTKILQLQQNILKLEARRNLAEADRAKIIRRREPPNLRQICIF
jgi:hypothetical protein